MSELDGSKESRAIHLDATFWNNLWQEKDTGWDLKAVSPPLKTYFDSMSSKNKSILIPGCGNAYEAEYLLQNGFQNITLIDISPILVQQLLEKFASFVGKELTIICGDFFKHSGSYDFIIEQTFLCALEKNKRQEYASKMHTLLNQDGKLVGLLFNKEFEKSPPFGGSKQEYLDLFSTYFLVERMEDCTQSVKPRLGAELIVELKKK